MCLQGVASLLVVGGDAIGSGRFCLGWRGYWDTELDGGSTDALADSPADRESVEHPRDCARVSLRSRGDDVDRCVTID